MYRVELSEICTQSIRNFVRNFHRRNIDIISGGGILGESDMIRTYKLGAVALREKIFEKCEEAFSSEIVPKQFYGEDKRLCSILNMGNIRLFVFYRENQENQVREILDIEFFRK